MEIYDLMLKISGCFNRLGIPYFVTGSVASIAYGEARFTNDIDIVADIKNEDIPGIMKCFPEDEYYLSEESIKDAIYHRFQFNIIHPASGLKVDVVIKKKDEFDIVRFSRANRFTMDNVDVHFAAPEDVILKKMEYYKQGGSEKHIRDIIGILKISKDLLDFEYIGAWTKKLFLEEIWKKINDQLVKPETGPAT